MNAAIAGVPERKTVWLLFNPFLYVAGLGALGLGLGAILLAGILGYFGRTHFDGVIDVHTGGAAPFWFFLAGGFVDWLCMALVLLVVGKLASKSSFRAIDVVGTQALARWPSILISLLALSPPYQRFNDEIATRLAGGDLNLPFGTFDGVVFIVTMLLILPILCWMIYLMYKAYSVSCNVKGWRGIGSFIPGLLIAEVLSKLAFLGLARFI